MQSNNQINKVVELIAVSGDLLLLNISFLLFLHFWEDLSCAYPFSSTLKAMMILLSLCYLACSRGKAWSSRAFVPTS